MIDILGDSANPRQGGNVSQANGLCRYCGSKEHVGSGCKLPPTRNPYPAATGQLVTPESEGMKEWKLSGRDPATYGTDRPSKCAVVPCEEPRRQASPFCTEHGAEVPGANVRQVGGDHYMKQAIQPWDYIVANKIGFLAGCAIKYISRYNSPGAGGIRDLEKAKHFLEKLIEVETQEIEDRGSDKL